MNDLGKAFTFPFKDPNWVTKFVVGAVFMVLCILVIGLFILVGYFVQVIQRAMRREEQALPEWTDIGVMLVVGFKFCIVYLIYLLPLGFLMAPLFALSILGAISHSESIGLLSGLYSAMTMIITIPYAIAFTLLHPIISFRFARNASISEALDIGAVVGTFKRNWQKTLIVALIATGIQSFAAVGVVFFIVGILATIFYSHLVSAYLYGILYLEQSQEGLSVQ